LSYPTHLVGSFPQWTPWRGGTPDNNQVSLLAGGGREITRRGVKDLPWDGQALTGDTIISADSLGAAEELARTCPFVTSIRVYELGT